MVVGSVTSRQPRPYFFTVAVSTSTAALAADEVELGGPFVVSPGLGAIYTNR